MASPSTTSTSTKSGATDSIVDIMAAAIGVHELGIECFALLAAFRSAAASSAPCTGPLPVPGPATLELLKGLPVVGVDVEGETVTPTGAAHHAHAGENVSALNRR